AGERARNVGHRHDLRRHVPRARVGADDIADLLLQRLVEPGPRLQTHEEHDAHVAAPFLPYRDRLDHLFQTFHRGVDLRRADAHAARIQHRVGAAVDHDAIVFGECGVITVVPYTGEALEVSCPIPRTVRIVPESDRHRREWRRANELAAVAAHGPAV